MIKEIESLIASGRYFEAHTLAINYCEEHPDDLRALQLCGLAMSKSGARTAAINFLEPVLEKNSEDVETAGILGGVYKDHFKKTAESDFARKSHETYLSNFEKTRSYYTGINAATMSQILGRGIAAREVAKEVVEIASKDDNFWAYATVGEAYLLLKDPMKALEYYKKAAEVGEGQFGMMGSVYAQLIILKHYIVVPERVISLFSPPKIAVFAGHMIDNNRAEERFPEYISEDIKDEIKKTLINNNIRIGFSSLACGSDILFVEALIELGGEVNIYVPFNRKDFLKASVSFAGEHWLNRFEKIEKDHKIIYLTQSTYEGVDLFFQFLGQVMIGAGIMRASLFHDKPFLLTVASENDQQNKPGGTKSVRSIWPYEQSILSINSDEFLSKTTDTKVEDLEPFQEKFAYSRLEQNKLIQFFVFATLINPDLEDKNEAIKEVGKKIREEFIEFPGQRRSGVTRKEVFGLYSRPHYAMDFALRLLEWTRQAGLEVRIALEAVLMTKGADPIKVIESTSNLKSLAFSDACYATMQFAAALSAEQPARYDFHHVGEIQIGNTDEGQEIYKIDQKVETALG